MSSVQILHGRVANKGVRRRFALRAQPARVGVCRQDMVDLVDFKGFIFRISFIDISSFIISSSFIFPENTPTVPVRAEKPTNPAESTT